MIKYFPINSNDWVKMPTNLKALGITKGSILVFSLDSSITAEVVNDTQIYFNGRNTSLSTAAIEVLKSRGRNPSSARGTIFWLYNGKSINELNS